MFDIRLRPGHKSVVTETKIKACLKKKTLFSTLTFDKIAAVNIFQDTPRKLFSSRENT